MSRLLADNDVLLKAAHWGMLDYIPTCTGIAWPATSVLESLRFRTSRRDPKLFRHPDIADALKARLDLTAPMPVPDPSVVARLQGIIDLDAGEIALIAAVLPCPDALLMTGDKRALAALAQSGMEDLNAHLQGRVVCLEHLLHHVLEIAGVARLAELVSPYPDLDTAARCVLPGRGRPDERDVREGLASYLRDLECRTKGMVRR